MFAQLWACSGAASTSRIRTVVVDCAVLSVSCFSARCCSAATLAFWSQCFSAWTFDGEGGFPSGFCGRF
eukprot:scaffold106394_cov75-Phaeocystis_antarctica.AAC.1